LVTVMVPACAGMLIAQIRAIAQKNAMLVPVCMIIDGIVMSAFDVSCTSPTGGLSRQN